MKDSTRNLLISSVTYDNARLLIRSFLTTFTKENKDIQLLPELLMKLGFPVCLPTMKILWCLITHLHSANSFPSSRALIWEFPKCRFLSSYNFSALNFDNSTLLSKSDGLFHVLTNSIWRHWQRMLTQWEIELGNIRGCQEFPIK